MNFWGMQYVWHAQSVNAEKTSSNAHKQSFQARGGTESSSNNMLLNSYQPKFTEKRCCAAHCEALLNTQRRILLIEFFNRDTSVNFFIFGNFL